MGKADGGGEETGRKSTEEQEVTAGLGVSSAGKPQETSWLTPECVNSQPELSLCSVKEARYLFPFLHLPWPQCWRLKIQVHGAIRVWFR